MVTRSEKSKIKREAKKEERKQILESGNFSIIPPSTNKTLLPYDTLKLFIDSFKYLLDSPNLETFIQLVKKDLYNRDYIKAFGDDDRRFAYCARWTPSRALAYSSLLSSLSEIYELIEGGSSHILSVGGGAGAELVALSSLFTQSKDFLDKDKADSNITIDLIDIADWSTIVDKLVKEIKKNWVYNSPESLNVNFAVNDILTMNRDSLKLDQLDLITLLFTTNELFTENRASSIRFFQQLTHCHSGCYLLITESAGSYSNIVVGTKTFPIQFLIDTILIGKDGESGDWELLKQSDSCWYRCGSDFDYPLKLENMRFFYRLYRKR